MQPIDHFNVLMIMPPNRDRHDLEQRAFRDAFHPWMMIKIASSFVFSVSLSAFSMLSFFPSHLFSIFDTQHFFSLKEREDYLLNQEIQKEYAIALSAALVILSLSLMLELEYFDTPQEQENDLDIQRPLIPAPFLFRQEQAHRMRQHTHKYIQAISAKAQIF